MYYVDSACFFIMQKTNHNKKTIEDVVNTKHDFFKDVLKSYPNAIRAQDYINHHVRYFGIEGIDKPTNPDLIVIDVYNEAQYINHLTDLPHEIITAIIAAETEYMESIGLVEPGEADFYMDWAKTIFFTVH